MPIYSGNQKNRIMRHRRVRTRVVGTTDRPRLAVFRSLKHVYAQVIDDSNGVTVASASSVDASVRGQVSGNKKTEVSKAVGKLLAERAKENGVESVVFDRGGYQYHGRVRALADAAREGGLKF